MERGLEEVTRVPFYGSDGRDGVSAPGDSVASEDGGLSFCKSVDSNSIPFEEALDAEVLFHTGNEDLNENEIKGSWSKLYSEDGERKRCKCFATTDVFDSIRSLKELLFCITEKFDAGRRLESISEVESTWVEDEMGLLLLEIKQAHKLGQNLTSLFTEHENTSEREKKELEIRILNLTEENEDIGNLLRIALLEKQDAEKKINLDRLKGNITNQKSMSILQYAEIGLQKVGFGFVLSSSTDELPLDDKSSSDVDGFKSEKESPNLIFTVENIMNKLRLEITELRRSLNKSRMHNECLQNLTDKQAHMISESNSYIKNLEEQEILLNRKIYELTIEIKEAREESSRWKEACELEVEAVKAFTEDHQKKLAILQKEYEWAKVSLDRANKKLTLKEKLVNTAIAAQSAAETSLRIADRRSIVLRKQIEELTKQTEEAECGGQWRSRYHVCWPWPHLLMTTLPSTSHSRRMPEMLPLLQ